MKMKRIIYTLACLLLSVGAWAEGNVAKIGETEYKTLAAAFEAVPTDGTETTITMLEDVDLTTTIAVVYGQNVVLDLNNHNITSTVLAIKNQGDLEVTGTGNITVNGTKNTLYGISNAGASAAKKANLIIDENVRITAPCVAVYTTYGKTIVNGTLANTQADASNIYSTLRLSQTSSEVIVAESANITGVVNAIYGDKGILEVNSANVGKIYADGSATQGLKIKKTAAIEELNTVGHAEFSDVEDYYVAAKAISACTGTVKLLSDINGALALSANKTVTLDLNGHKVSAETYPIKVEGNLTITGDGTVQSTGMGSSTAVQAAAYVLNNGKLTILSGNYVAGYEGEEGNPAVYVRDNAVVEIKGGDFVGGSKYLLNKLDASRETSVIEVTGGTFHNNFNPADNTAEGEHTNFVADGYETVDNGDGTFTVKEKNYVAQVGEKKYESLAEAIEAAQNGETVKLLADATANAMIEISEKDITLDLNGKTISPVDGTKISGGLIGVHNGAGLTIDDSSAEKTGKITSGNSGNVYAAVQVTVKDDAAIEPAKLIVNNGNLEGYYYAISGNGTRHNTEITINDGTFKGLVNSPSTDDMGLGIFHPQDGKLTINGGEFEGPAAGVEIRAGELNVSGGSFKATATEFKEAWNGSGTTVVGAAIAISQHSTNKDIKVNITGGTFEGIKAVYEVDLNTATGDKSDNININIEGGYFKGVVASENVLNFISGGTFNKAVPEEYCAVGFIPKNNGDGTYGVTEKDYVAKIGDKKYESLAEAIEAAQNGETVTLLADATINEMITIADGKAVTVDMNGKNISGSSYFQVTHGKLNLTGEGVYSTSAIYALKVVGATTDQGADYSVISVDENVTVKSSHATYGYVAMVSYDTSVMGNKASYGAKIDFNGKGEGRLGLYVNGTIQATTGNVPEVIVGSTATIKSEEYALYAAGYANYTINGKLEGEGGIEAKGGRVVVNEGAVITATSTEQSHEKNGNGTSTKGYAIVSVKNSGYAGNAIEVKGGTITGKILSLDDQSGDEIATGLEVSGGTFDAPVPEKYCADGFIPTDDGEGHYGVKNGSYVAQICDVKYETLSAAVSAATEGQTIKLIAAVNEAVSNTNANNFTIDLNGKTWTSDETSTFKNDGGIVTITDTDAAGKGTVQNTANENDKGIAVWARTGSVVIESGTFVSQSNYEATLYVGTSATNLGDKTPTITVDGGTIKNEAEGKYAHNSALLPLTLNIINNIANADTYQAIVVNGGTFFGNDPSVGDDSQLNKINNNSNFVNSEKHAEYKNGVFIIEEGGYKAQTGYIKYVTLDAAIDAAPDTETTIYLLINAETTKDELPANITIDARSYELTMPSFVVLDGEAFTLPNITGAETYKVKKATYIRTNISATEWGTVCLPFSLTSGNGATYYTFGNISESTLTVNEATSVNPNTPVVSKKGTGDLTINETNATVSLNATPVATGALVGTYTDANIPANGSIYFINGDQFHKVQVSVKVPMYRAYINNTAPGAKPDVLNLNVIGIGNADGIESVVMDATNTAEAIYDVNGRQLTAPQKGLNIMKLANGKTVKVLLK